MEMTAGATSKGQGSPSPRRTPLDEEAAVGLGFLDGDNEGEKEVEDDPFHFSSTKNVPLDRLRSWRIHSRLEEGGGEIPNTPENQSPCTSHTRTVKPPDGDFRIGQEQLVLITKDHNISALEEHGGMFLWDAWQDLTLIILIIAAVASLVLEIKTEVVRDGRRMKLSIYEIVVGDVVPLNIGDQVPADGVLISGHSLAIDESSMTGESKIVTSVGVNTEWGMLMASISEDNGEETPLQVRLNGVATFIGIVGLAVGVSVLFVLLARYFTGHTKNVYGTRQFKAGVTGVGTAVNGVIKIFTIAVTIVVVAVPEGLPLAVTLTWVLSSRQSWL